MPRARLSGLVLIAALSTFAACKKKEGLAARPDTKGDSGATAGGSTLALPVVGEEVRKGDLILTVTARGQIRTDATTSLKALTGGTVEQVYVRPGDHVRKGQILARLDSIPLQLDLESAQAQLSTAQVNYDADIAPDSAVTGKTPTGARQRYARARAGLDNAMVQMKKAQRALEHAVVVAPYDGVIDKVSVAAGDEISAGQEVAVVVDITNLRVEAQVLEHDLPLLRIGGDALITVAANPDKPVHGTIAAILPIVDSIGRAGRAFIRIRGDGMLRPGMYTEVRLEANRLKDRIIVPAAAVVEREARPLVFVARNGIAEWQYINRGRTNGRETEILPDSSTGQIPLNPGDTVLVSGHLTLTHQAPIRLVAKKESQP